MAEPAEYGKKVLRKELDAVASPPETSVKRAAVMKQSTQSLDLNAAKTCKHVFLWTVNCVACCAALAQLGLVPSRHSASSNIRTLTALKRTRGIHLNPHWSSQLKSVPQKKVLRPSHVLSYCQVAVAAKSTRRDCCSFNSICFAIKKNRYGHGVPNSHKPKSPIATV